MFNLLLCLFQSKYEELVEKLLAQQTEAVYHQRLAEAFTELTPPNTALKLDRPGKRRFQQCFDKFLVNVRGFLCVK